jgi:hypothetical protein
LTPEAAAKPAECVVGVLLADVGGTKLPVLALMAVE